MAVKANVAKATRKVAITVALVSAAILLAIGIGFRGLALNYIRNRVMQSLEAVFDGQLQVDHLTVSLLPGFHLEGHIRAELRRDLFAHSGSRAQAPN
jgi:hypothetical protein